MNENESQSQSQSQSQLPTERLHRSLALEARILDGAATLVAAAEILGRRRSRRALEGAMLGCYMLRYAAEHLGYRVAVMMRDDAKFEAFRAKLDEHAAGYRRIATDDAGDRISGGAIAAAAIAGHDPKA